MQISTITNDVDCVNHLRSSNTKICKLTALKLKKIMLECIRQKILWKTVLKKCAQTCTNYLNVWFEWNTTGFHLFLLFAINYWWNTWKVRIHYFCRIPTVCILDVWKLKNQSYQVVQINRLTIKPMLNFVREVWLSTNYEYFNRSTDWNRDEFFQDSNV